jgi:hypothetical protein
MESITTGEVSRRLSRLRSEHEWLEVGLKVGQPGLFNAAVKESLRKTKAEIAELEAQLAAVGSSAPPSVVSFFRRSEPGKPQSSVPSSG